MAPSTTAATGAICKWSPPLFPQLANTPITPITTTTTTNLLPGTPFQTREIDDAILEAQRKRLLELKKQHSKTVLASLKCKPADHEAMNVTLRTWTIPNIDRVANDCGYFEVGEAIEDVRGVL